MSAVLRSRAFAHLKDSGKRVAIDTITFKSAKAPRLRFDRTAVGLIKRLRLSLSRSVPEGNTIVVTVTAPIRQDSKTGAALADKIRRLLATNRAQLKATIFGNRIEVRILKGGAARTSRLLGFVHNPVPSPAVLFDVTRSLLACIGLRKRPRGGDRWLIVVNENGLAPVETVRQVCIALRARSVFKRILLAESAGVRAL
jgi:hypothetical protein